MKRMTTLFAGLALSVFSVSAQALILDFQSAGFSDGTGGSYASIYQQDGFDIRTPQTDSMHFHMGQLATGDPEGALPGWLGFHNGIGDNSVLNEVRLTRIDGGAFNFDSFDILGTFASAMWTSRQNRWHNPEITIMSSNGDVMVIPASTWQPQDPETPDQTFLVGWTNVTWVTFLADEFSSNADGEITMMDNLVVSAVPVPAAVWMLGSALLALVGMRRSS
ncbi:MAG: VPLPA-CTERM sorting domain-containing protein [Gammaproteobacteria bacterium]|nr:VPLPA-CTERM sorting domain-containing protein [Gammaproteobacteria bacterium]NNF62538.1 VPLPA-CTERM sorting domain-containing protein [Gammaproteobacteria bacterium]NNM20100.1 VPLPA-CTERM sorting domain-containing protein [Gammaproteobacteria bacterium]